jgi:hypothetical protein
MPFDYLDTTTADAPSNSGKFEYLDEPNYLEKTAANIIPDIKETAKGIADTVKGPALDIASGDIASAMPKLVKEGEQFFENPKENLEQMARPVMHPVDYFQEHPVQQTVNLLAAREALSGPETAALPKTAEPAPAPVAPPAPEAPAGTTPTAAPQSDPLAEVRNFINSKFGKVAEKPGIVQKLGNILEEESARLGGKDLGLQLGQVKSMGSGFEGVEKAKALISYAREKGYLSPTLSDAARKSAIETNMNKAGQQLGALRKIADTRAAPPVDAIRNELKNQLTEKYGIDAPGEVNKVLAKFDKAAKTPTFSGMADLATDLHKAATPATKMGLHPGPTTDAANIIARINNEASRATMNPQESKMFTDSLRDFGAHKKLEQAVAASSRKARVGRGAPGSLTNRLIQEGLDRGGYRLGGNIADKLAGWTKTNPKATLPQFFEELAHQADSSIDDAISGMFAGGAVPGDIADFVARH